MSRVREVRKRLRITQLSIVLTLLIVASLGALYASAISVESGASSRPPPVATADFSAGPIAPIFTDVTPVPMPEETADAGPTAAPAAPSSVGRPADPVVDAADRPDPVPASAPAGPAPDPVGVSAGQGGADLGRVTALTNEARADAGCAPLSVDPTLTQQAQAQSAKQSAAGRMHHSTYPGGWSYWGENVAYGYDTADEVVAAWLDSDGHRRNMLDCGFTLTGVSYKAGYWTQAFATP